MAAEDIFYGGRRYLLLRGKYIFYCEGSISSKIPAVSWGVLAKRIAFARERVRSARTHIAERKRTIELRV